MQILSAQQRVKLIVLGYPYGADMLSLMANAARTGGTSYQPEHEADWEAAKVAASRPMLSVRGERFAAGAAGSSGLDEPAAELEGSEYMGRSAMLPDQVDWLAGLHQPLSLLRAKSWA